MVRVSVQLRAMCLVCVIARVSAVILHTRWCIFMGTRRNASTAEQLLRGMFVLPSTQHPGCHSLVICYSGAFNHAKRLAHNTSAVILVRGGCHTSPKCFHSRALGWIISVMIRKGLRSAINTVRMPQLLDWSAPSLLIHDQFILVHFRMSGEARLSIEC